ncbi:uncharacterized protein TrAFT101_005711 [Trichoderma asperellum]|uniref:Fascin domain-containing protein n=1 Tax=Trichoderma asperellum (strain ATCC 204424 / CBS 433.97 / NBRC 101777) TaxID=1042311 RepID=A0A2T3Z6Y3_TRIA4|nr:hypothetical protein M441DRAFT_58045 [Trichoderma asperellum CBS 433.97]PTB40530.1 hypothetical protein M441DRAFT_58045 [Trichoderma asperellum CBS 433.97]UKZ90710.1 hypothetical protein TrAFT101_005711 [Trichoderma asperellum]
MGENSWEEVISTSTSSSTGECPTPADALSTMSDTIVIREKETDKDKRNAIALPPSKAVENQPLADKSLMIRTTQEPHRILTLCNGELKFLSKPIPGGGAFWHCVKKDGWYGFRNTVSGAYLGHDTKGKITATKPQHESDEYFIMDRHEKGGYILLMRNDAELLQVSISEDGRSLTQQKETGTSWDFIDVQYIHHSMSIAYPNMTTENL